MNTINNVETVKNQYQNADKLNTRISIHDKYSINKQGFGNWIVSNYEIQKGMRILELGCGTGDMWIKHMDVLECCDKVVLSDFSKGMLEQASMNIGKHEHIIYQVIDIQDIPFTANYFDVVIANMMLYHVPDLEKGLREVKRVLKPGGKFYCATYGENGIVEYVSKLLRDYGVKEYSNHSFTLQNGSKILQNVFSNVKKLEYLDALAVSQIDDIVEYLYSLSDIVNLNGLKKEDVKKILSEKMENGILAIPKEYGMFVAD